MKHNNIYKFKFVKLLMNTKERGRERKMERGLREKIRQCAEVLQGSLNGRVYNALKECKAIFDSMGGAKGPRNDDEYRKLFGQEPPVAAGADSYAPA